MIKKCLSFALICLLLTGATPSFISAQTRTNSADSTTSKVKTAVQKRGIGENNRVTVKMLNGTKLKGYISRINEDSFTLTDSKTNQPSSIAYVDVEKVSNRMSKGDKITLGIVAGAAIAGAVVLAAFIKLRCDNEGC